MIVKDTDPRNLSRLSLRLTPKGETAYLHHEELHQEFDEIFMAMLKDVTEQNKEFLKDFLNSLDGKLDDYEKEVHLDCWEK